MEQKNTFNDTYLAEWIHGEITNNQLKELVSEDDYNAYIKLKSGINLYEALEAPMDNTLNSVKNRIKQGNPATKKQTKIRFLNTKTIFAVAASIAILFSISTFLANKDVTFQSGFGEHKTVALLDNSEVILNAKSELTYNKKDWKTKREVFLKGEAFFKVQKGSTFTVITDNGTVTVLGTQFNINAQNNFFEVICYEGKVKVINKGKNFVLTPNKSVRSLNGTITEETLDLTTVKPSWILGESSFRSISLKEVITALEKQFNIQIDDKNIDNSIIFTGAFDNTNLNIALAAVFKTTQINYRLKNNIVVLSK